MKAKRSRLRRGILYRVYLLIMRGESPHWLSVRRWVLDQLLGRKHRNVNIFPYVFIEGLEGLKLGDNVAINRQCNISAAGGLTIGSYVSIGHDTSIITAEHIFADPEIPINQQWVEERPVTIGDNVWIGARVCILAGVSLASGTIVAAGSVVKNSVIDENCTIAGVPARVVRIRNRSG